MSHAGFLRMLWKVSERAQSLVSVAASSLLYQQIRFRRFFAFPLFLFPLLSFL
jgi:hypothetical protein